MANRLTPCFRDISSWLAVTNPASNTFTPTPLKGGRAAISPKASPTASLERKIRSLQVMKRALQQLVSACESDGPASECSFLENLNEEDMP